MSAAQASGSGLPMVHALLRDRKAGPGLEFALLSTPLLMVFFFMFTIGLQLFTQSTMDAAVQAGARQIRIGLQRGTSDAGVRSVICGMMAADPLVCANLQIYVASSGNIAALGSFASLTPATVSNGTLSKTGFSPGTSGSYVLLQVAYTTTALLPFMPTPPTFLATVVFENET